MLTAGSTFDGKDALSFVAGIEARLRESDQLAPRTPTEAKALGALLGEYLRNGGRSRMRTIGAPYLAAHGDTLARLLTEAMNWDERGRPARMTPHGSQSPPTPPPEAVSVAEGSETWW